MKKYKIEISEIKEPKDGERYSSEQEVYTQIFEGEVEAMAVIIQNVIKAINVIN